MSVQPYDIIAGPAKVYLANTGTAYPLIDAAPSGSWKYLGYTDGGVKVAHQQTTKNLMVDQTILVVKVIRTEQMMAVSFNMAELTLENYGLVLNNISVTSVSAGSGTAGYKFIPLSSTVDMPQFGMLLRGPSPYGNFFLQYEIAASVQIGKPEVSYKRDDKAVLSTEWECLNDVNNDGQFGVLRAETAAAL